MLVVGIKHYNSDLRRVLELIDTKVVMELIGEAEAEETRSHFMKLHSSRHKSKTGRSFYQRASESVEVGNTSNLTAEVNVPHTGITLRYFGGTVKPSGRLSKATGRPIRRLAIPIEDSRGEGRNPSEFKDIFFCLSNRKKGLLVSKKYGPVYSLVSQSIHKKDLSVLPTEGAYVQRALEVLREYVAEVKRDRGL